MKNIYKSLLIVSSAAIFTGCATPPKYDYTAFRESKPRSIVVLPPLNNTPDVRATYSFLSTVSSPLAESGYYVFPVALVDQTFKENGLQNPGDMHNAPLPKLREIFGTDAALFISIDQYGSSYKIITSNVTVTATAKLVDTRTGQLLWNGTASASSAESNNNSGGGLVGLLVAALVKQIAGSIGDPGYQYSRIASTRLLSARSNGLLYGPRSPMFEKDQ